jgi:heme/copper-type cytochrome/quinol oxidase subunit 2
MDLVLSILTICVYGVPIIIAVARKLPAATVAWITFITILIGWTVIGWMVLLAWSIAAKEAQPTPDDLSRLTSPH